MLIEEAHLDKKLYEFRWTPSVAQRAYDSSCVKTECFAKTLQNLIHNGSVLANKYTDISIACARVIVSKYELPLLSSVSPGLYLAFLHP